MLLFAGCGAHRQIKSADIVFVFDCKADVSCPEGDITYSLERAGAADTALQVLSGGAQGLGWDWGGDGFTLTYKGLAMKSGNCALPETSCACVLVRILDAAEKDGSLTKTHDNEFSGNTDNIDFTLTANEATGHIQTISAPGRKIQAKFYDYQQKELDCCIP